MTTLFISDLHLDPGRPDATRAFHRFLDDRASGAKAQDVPVEPVIIERVLRVTQ